jgi:hypothetical protein
MAAAPAAMRTTGSSLSHADISEIATFKFKRVCHISFPVVSMHSLKLNAAARTLLRMHWLCHVKIIDRPKARQDLKRAWVRPPTPPPARTRNLCTHEYCIHFQYVVLITEPIAETNSCEITVACLCPMGKEGCLKLFELDL